MVWRKKVSNIDWCDEAIKNFLSLIIFSLPLIVIFADKKIFKQNSAQYPISFPPNKTKLRGIIKAGKNKIEIKIIPVKKNSENKIFLIISIKN